MLENLLSGALNAIAHFGRDVRPSCAVASAVGFLSHHLYFIRGFRDMNVRNIIGGHLLVLVLLLYRTTASSGYPQGLVNYAAIASAYFATLLTSIGIYCVFFHPLRNFPGPLGLAITQMYMPWLGRHLKLHQVYDELHVKYGQFVRVGPNSISTSHIDAIALVHGPRSTCSKRDTAMYDSLHVNGEQNLDSLADDKVHRERRAIWDRSLSMSSLKRHETATRRVMHDWLGRIDELGSSPIDTSCYAKLIGFDNMGYVGFSTDFGTVREGREDRMLELLEVTFYNAALMGQVHWPQALVMSMPKFGMQKEFEQLAERMANQRIERETGQEFDMLKYLLDDLRAEKSRSVNSMDTVYADCQGILIGATDTVAASLGLLFYFIARDADLRQRLYEAIAPLYGKTEPGEFTVADLHEVELFDAIFQETLRLKSPVPISGPRMTPPGGLNIGGTFVPAGVIVYTPSQAYHLSDEYFKQPREFIPERWTTRPDLVIDKRAYFPFNVGRYDCVGKRLAKRVLMMTIAYTLYNYDFEFAPGEDGSRFEREEKWQVILKPGRLGCVFTKRERA